MTKRFNITFSIQLERAVERAALESFTTKSEIVRKALTLYLHAHRATREHNLKLALVKKDMPVETEVIGL